MKRTLKTLTAAGVVAAITGAGVVYFGVINVGADEPHSDPVYALLSTARDRSIEVRSRDIKVPDLSEEALIRAGAGNYNSMCIGCHLAPKRRRGAGSTFHISNIRGSFLKAFTCYSLTQK